MANLNTSELDGESADEFDGNQNAAYHANMVTIKGGLRAFTRRSSTTEELAIAGTSVVARVVTQVARCTDEYQLGQLIEVLDRQTVSPEVSEAIRLMQSLDPSTQQRLLYTLERLASGEIRVDNNGEISEPRRLIQQAQTPAPIVVPPVPAPVAPATPVPTTAPAPAAAPATAPPVQAPAAPAAPARPARTAPRAPTTAPAPAAAPATAPPVQAPAAPAANQNWFTRMAGAGKQAPTPPTT